MIELSAEILERFSGGMEEAHAAAVKEPEAMTLSTLNARGGVSSRVVLLKALDERGFVFYTNTESRKGRQLADNPHAALNFLWREIQRQVRVEGSVETVTAAEADGYFASRPRGSQIGAWASKQSQPLDSRQTLLERVAAAEKRFAGQEIPRPEYWTGYRVRPRMVEFWYGSEHRLHDRFRYYIAGNNWACERLYP